MAYPSRNTSTYSSPTKNASTSSNSEASGQEFLDIGEGFVLLVDTSYKLLIEPFGGGWNYQAKS